MQNRIRGILAICCLAFVTATNAAEITGTWKTVDDKTGYVRGLVKIVKEADGSYSGTIIDHFTIPGGKPINYCDKCPEPDKGKPLTGLKILNHLTAEPGKPNSYTKGNILDPLTGRTYQSKAQMTEDGKKLRLRGYVGVSVIGRSQTWIREE